MSNELPDLTPSISDAINHLARQHQFRSEQQLAAEVTPEQLSVPCQRTWFGVTTLNQKTNGGDFTACVANVTQEDGVYPWFFLFCRPPGSESWQPLVSQGGERREMVQRVPGKVRVPRTCICIGGLGVVPNGGRIQIEMEDGSVHEDHAVGGCCIAMAPLTVPTEDQGTITVRFSDADGNELQSETV